MTNGNEPSTPAIYTNSDGSIQHDVYLGLTKREYFASQALAGILSNPEAFNKANFKNLGFIPKSAVEFADALIEALNK